ncbi:unnamed protein product [Camellia sinensis]
MRRRDHEYWVFGGILSRVSSAMALDAPYLLKLLLSDGNESLNGTEGTNSVKVVNGWQLYKEGHALWLRGLKGERGRLNSDEVQAPDTTPQIIPEMAKISPMLNGHPQITERELTSANDGNVAEDLMQNHEDCAELRASVFEAIEEEDRTIEKEEGLPPALLGSCNDCAKQLHASPSGKIGREIVGEKRKKIDDSVDMVVSKEGFDDEDKLLRTVFVGNLTLKVKKKALFKEFSQFGEVESVRIQSIPLLDTKKPTKGAIIQKKINDAVDSVHVYIVFETEQAAQASLAHNMAAVGGNHIRVDRACPPRKKLKGDNAPLYDNKRMVFVGNLPFDVKAAYLLLMINQQMFVKQLKYALVKFSEFMVLMHTLPNIFLNKFTKLNCTRLLGSMNIF